MDLADNFEKSLTKIFGALEFEHILGKEETSHSEAWNCWKAAAQVMAEAAAMISKETIQVLELCAPDALMREQANLRLRMSGCPNSNAWESNVKRYDQYKESANKWTTLTESVDIMKEYDFCNYLQGYSKKKIVRSSTGTVDERHSRDCGCRGHVVLGSFLGLLGFYLFSFMAHQGDSYAWVYYWVDRIAFVDVRCQETNTTSAASPWCDATDYLLMSRTTLWVSHGDMRGFGQNLDPQSPMYSSFFPGSYFVIHMLVTGIGASKRLGRNVVVVQQVRRAEQRVGSHHICSLEGTHTCTSV